MTKKKRIAAMMGMARVSWRAKKGQLEREGEKDEQLPLQAPWGTGLRY